MVADEPRRIFLTNRHPKEFFVVDAAVVVVVVVVTGNGGAEAVDDIVVNDADVVVGAVFIVSSFVTG